MAQWKYLLEALKKPEWEAAIALFIQASILLLQAKILSRHAETMEEHKSIAKTQADTAELIAKALQQQGEVLSEQTKIMEGQFKFQKNVEIRMEREKIFKALVAVAASLRCLTLMISKIPAASYSAADRERVGHAFETLAENVMKAQESLLTSIYLPKEEVRYFVGYVNDVSDLKETGNIGEDYVAIMALNKKYEEVVKRLGKAAQTPVS